MAKLTDDKIIQLLDGQITAAKNYQEELSVKREEFYKTYRAMPYGNEREGWAQTVHPTVHNAVEWLKPHLYEIFTGDFFAFTGDDEEAAERLKKYIRFKLFTQQPGDQSIEDFIHYALISHYGIFKIYHRDDYKNRKKTFESLNDEEMSQLTALPDVEITKYEEVNEVDPLTGEDTRSYEGVTVKWTETEYKGPWIECIKPGSYYELPGYPETKDNPFVAHVEARSLDYIKKREAEGVYKKGSHKACVKLVQERYGTLETEGENSTLFDSDDISTPDFVSYTDDEVVGNAMVEVWECYCKLDIDNDGYLEDAIVWLADGKHVLREPIENKYSEPPFVKGSIYREPHKAIGRPMADLLDNWQRVNTNMLRAIQDSALLSANRGFLTTDTRTQNALEKWAPGMTGLVGSLQETNFKIVDPGSPNQFIFKAYEQTNADTDKLSGINESMMGLDRDAMNKTKGGMEMKLTASMARQRLYARRLARAFQEVLRKVIRCLSIYPPEDDQLVVGQDIEMQKEDFRGEYTVEIDVGVGAQDNKMRAQLMDQHLQFLLQAGLQLGIAAPKHILRTLNKKYDYLDIDATDLVISEDEFEQRQQQAQQQPVPGPGGGVPVQAGSGQGPTGNSGQPPVSSPGGGVPQRMANNPASPRPPLRPVPQSGARVPVPPAGPR